MPLSTATKVIRKHDIDTKDPSTINYHIVHAYVEKTTTLEKAIQRIHAEKAPNADWKVELEELVGWFQAVTNVTKEKRLADPVVSSQPVVSTATDKTMDKLTQSFEKLNISIGALVQQNLNQSRQPRYPYTYPRNPQAGPYTNEQNVGASSQAMGVNAFTTRQNMENTYFYCYNRDPDLPPHWFQD